MQTCPSGNYWEYYAIAMGSRSQASKTYLEKKLEDFESCDLDALVKHALRALEESCGTRKKEDKDGRKPKKKSSSSSGSGKGGRGGTTASAGAFSSRRAEQDAIAEEVRRELREAAEAAKRQAAREL